MFGIVRPCRHRLGDALRTQWTAHLCGLCLTLRDDHDRFARVVTHYDGLLVSVLTEAQAESVTGRRRTAGPCPLHGMRGAWRFRPSGFLRKGNFWPWSGRWMYAGEPGDRLVCAVMSRGEGPDSVSGPVGLRSRRRSGRTGRRRGGGAAPVTQDNGPVGGGSRAGTQGRLRTSQTGPSRQEGPRRHPRNTATHPPSGRACAYPGTAERHSCALPGRIEYSEQRLSGHVVVGSGQRVRGVPDCASRARSFQTGPRFPRRNVK